ncbi:HCP-like protein [Ascodesmis nigricans]|uniref:HCP-like protein n=1 Tax=Ascodesmis nigricans TaxID=341454 RepID=A0A4S2N2U2_9PEZI|nr:HCP-like protein [Ascodesmis nigricans]
MRWSSSRTSQLCLLLAALSVLPSSSLAATTASDGTNPSTAALTSTPPSNPSAYTASPESQALVTEARRILETLDPLPSSPADSIIPGLSWGLLWRYTKTLLLWHTPETAYDAETEETKQHSAKRKTVEEAASKLEAARKLGRNDDALFLLAEMNFYGNWSHPRDYTKAFSLYKELADMADNHTAQNMVGFMYATGFRGSVKRDQAKALLYHTFAALNGNTRSEMTIAFRHYTGISAPRNCEEAAYYYKRVAEKAIDWYESGPPGGQHLQKNVYRLADDVGGVYGEGASAVSSGLNALRQRNAIDTVSDVGDIVEYLELLARKNNLPETFSLGKLYYDGSRGLPRNLPQAKHYFQKVARHYWSRDGSVLSTMPGVEKWAGRAAGYLGTMALRGEGGPQDFKLALTWFKRGLQTGDVNSMNGLGYMYLKAFGVKQDRQKAAELFKSATSYDFPAAQVNYGKLLSLSGEIDQAKRYFEAAARHRDVEAFYYLGNLNMMDTSRDRSCPLAVAYFKIVAERVENIHSPLAWANAAYERGDKESALIGYMMAAEQGYESAQANVAWILDQEKSALQLHKPFNLNSKPAAPSRSDEELALIYWTRSAKQANTDSLVKMGDYYLKGIGTEPDPEKAATCYSAASEHQASAQALWNIGWMHENGIGMAQDFHLAKRFYDLAFETNHEAYLPVTLALLKLRVRSAWNTITHGSVPGIKSTSKHPDDLNDAKVTPSFTEILKSWYKAATADIEPPQDQHFDDLDGMAHDDDHDDPHIPGDDFYGDEYLGDADLTESLIILGLAGAVALLVYYRQWRAQIAARRRRQEEIARARAEGRDPPPPPPEPQLPDIGPNGIWGDGMPGWGMPH